MSSFVTANGKPIEAKLPCALEEFSGAQCPRRGNVTLAVVDEWS